MNITFEKGSPDDIDALTALYDDVCDYLTEHVNYPGWRKGLYPDRQTAMDGIAENNLFIARDEGRIAGTVILRHVPEDAYAQAKWQIDADYKDILVIYTLAVHPDYYGRAVGAEMMQFILDYAQQVKMKAVRLDVHESNWPAIQLYEKSGFKYIDSVDLGLGEFGLKWFKLYEKVL